MLSGTKIERLVCRKKETALIVGEAIIGSMCAYFLRRKGFQGKIMVMEEDPSYQYSSTTLSAASIRTQFACSFSVEMSLFGARFIKGLAKFFGDVADVGFEESGYLLLGSKETEATRLQAMELQVLGIGPGTILTEMLAQAIMTSEEARHGVLCRTPMKRCGEPSEIASVAAFLASEDASYMIVQTVYPDGGRLASNYTVPVSGN